VLVPNLKESHMLEPVTFAIVVDGEVVSHVSYPQEPPYDGVIAILRTGPVYVEVPNPVDIGCTWDGNSFSPPPA